MAPQERTPPAAALRLVAELENQGIRDPQVLDAIARVPREAFVREADLAHAYDNAPLPIGHGQTISQPYIVALMTELAQVGPGSRVLEVGTGCGYQTAVLAALGADVWSMEVVEPLGLEAADRLSNLGVEGVHLRIGDAYGGWPEHAPFDAIVVTAAPPQVPQALLDQLADNGRLVIPVGSLSQSLQVITRRGNDYQTAGDIPVRFVPMTGQAQQVAR